MATHEIEVFIAMDVSGYYEVGCTQDEADERFEENIGGYRRIVKINVKMAAPVVAEANVSIPDEAGELKAEAAA